MRTAYRTVLLLVAPLLLASILGCGGGGGGINDAVSVMQRQQRVVDAWQNIRHGEPEKAEISFRGALRDNPSVQERNDIRCGLGWAMAGQGRWDEAIEHFTPVSGMSNDALIGLAGVYMARGRDGDIDEALKLLQRAGMWNPEATLKSERGLSYGTAEGQAMIAVCYLLKGRDDQAVIHAKAAKKWDSGWSNTTVDRIHKAILIDLGLGD